MIGRQRTDLPSDLYPTDPWAIVEESFAPRFVYLTETIFALSNGYLGIRGTVDEGSPVHLHGTFVNGYHETWPITHAENAFGLARTGQTIVNVPDATSLRVEVDGTRLSLNSLSGVTQRRWLDFRHGVLERRVRFTTASGIEANVAFRRLVSLEMRQVAAFSVTVAVDRPARVSVTSRMVNRQDRKQAEELTEDDPRRAQSFSHRVLEPRAATLDGLRFSQGWVTARSGLGLIASIDHRLSQSATTELNREANDFGYRFTADVTPDQPLVVEKFAHYRRCGERPSEHDRAAVTADLDRCQEIGFDGLAESQAKILAGLWDRADVEVGTSADTQRAIRWSLFQMLQASVQLEEGSIPAKGLTGQAYDGHYFRDTEIYLLPFLARALPDKAKEILLHRYQMLDAARVRAAELSQRGALFPWRTITGEEASAYFLAGTAQYHINADVTYAIRTYVEATGDEDFLWDHGTEIAAETARMWEDLGFFRNNRFHIHGVTGPDEYTALVDDNAFTNVMARMNMRYAAELASRMRAEQPERWKSLVDRLGITDEEITRWRLAADAMYIPYDPDLGITPQDDDFLKKEPWDFAGTPANKYPLLLHFHPLVIYRYQVLKQADVMLADFLVGDEFSPELKRANYDYYDPITTGDSSLSACVQSIIASEIGYSDAAMDHFMHALFMDLADLAGNTTDGVHMASAGGVWQALVHGFLGLRRHGEGIRFDPRLPADWTHMTVGFPHRGREIRIRLEPDAIHFELRSGDPLEIEVGDQKVRLEPGDTRVQISSQAQPTG
ncbi:MAG: glycosyl hydrolase family 65 protein [Acidimicrobiia bacterium]|nr:glycosyl hydrolase family 65 protein [Acidimicrobiia bacterium]